MEAHGFRVQAVFKHSFENSSWTIKNKPIVKSVLNLYDTINRGIIFLCAK